MGQKDLKRGDLERVLNMLGFSQCDGCFLGDHPKPNASTGGG